MRIEIFSPDAGCGEIGGRWRRGDWFRKLRRHAQSIGVPVDPEEDQLGLGNLLDDDYFLLGRAGNAPAIGWLRPGQMSPRLRDLAQDVFERTDPLPWIGVILLCASRGITQVVPRHWNQDRGLRIVPAPAATNG